MDRPPSVAALVALVQEHESRAAEVARLLHDDVGQTLTAIGMHLRVMGGDPETVEQVSGYLGQVMESVRTASYKLHSNLVERLGLPMAIERLVAMTREKQALPLRLTIESERRFSAPIGYAVYRIIELALENVAHHAGARHAEVRLSAGASGLAAEVRDDGCGFDPDKVRISPPGIGIILMEAYAGGVGLHLRIDSAAGRGTIVQIQTS